MTGESKKSLLPSREEAGGEGTRPAEGMPQKLLGWYDLHRRTLPWRAAPGKHADPYAVWLSEIMLQQTTVATVKGYFDRFMARWPTVEALATASLDEVLHAWQGLGYYSRARNLHACAREVAARLGGRFPESEDELRHLPGIGAYTAAAISAIAFGRRATVMDGNVGRVMARIHAVEIALPGAKPILRAHAGTLTPRSRPGDYAQAVMDLGATICTPRKPRCMLCPWGKDCRAHALGIEESLPRKETKAERPTRRGTIFWIVREDGAVLMRRRAEKGLLGGLMEFPSTPWREGDASAQALAEAPVAARAWQILPGEVIHVFTHFRLSLIVASAEVENVAIPEAVWIKPRDFPDHALPTLMKKVARHAIAGLDRQ